MRTKWAIAVLTKAFPGRRVVPIGAANSSGALGAFHCPHPAALVAA
jgi:hypothetical protein